MDTTGDFEGFPHQDVLIVAMHAYRIPQMYEWINIHFAYLYSQSGIFTAHHIGIQVHGRTLREIDSDLNRGIYGHFLGSFDE